MSDMRAKVTVVSVTEHKGISSEKTGEELIFVPVSKKEGYGPDGLDENNTFAKYSPAGEFRLSITNAALFGKFEIGQEYYVDFVRAPQ